MAKWAKIKSIVVNTEDEERNDLLNIKTEVVTLLKDLYFDLEEIQFFTNELGSDGNEIENQSQVIFKSGLSVHLMISPENLIYLIKTPIDEQV